MLKESWIQVVNNLGLGARGARVNMEAKLNTGLGEYVFKRQMGEGTGTDSVFR